MFTKPHQFTNQWSVHSSVSYAGKPIKCPVCGNYFFEAESNDANYLIHVPRVVKEGSDEFIRESEFTCPFFKSPFETTVNRWASDFHNDSLAPYFKDIYLNPFDPDDGYDLEPNSFLPALFNLYSKMVKRNKTACKNCGGKYFSYKCGKNGENFSYSFCCRCISSKGLPDLIRLAVDFMTKYNLKFGGDFYDRSLPKLDKNDGIINAILPSLPEGVTKRRIPKVLPKPSIHDASSKRSDHDASPKPSITNASNSRITREVESNYIISHTLNGYISFN